MYSVVILPGSILQRTPAIRRTERWVLFKHTPAYFERTAKSPEFVLNSGLSGNKCLTMTYFHGRPSTIIGAKAFHGPVRDGKAWVHFAMVVKRNWLRRSRQTPSRSRSGAPPIWNQRSRPG